MHQNYTTMQINLREEDNLSTKAGPNVSSSTVFILTLHVTIATFFRKYTARLPLKLGLLFPEDISQVGLALIINKPSLLLCFGFIITIVFRNSSFIILNSFLIKVFIWSIMIVHSSLIIFLISSLCGITILVLGLDGLCSKFYQFFFSFMLILFTYFSFHSMYFSFQCSYFSPHYANWRTQLAAINN